MHPPCDEAFSVFAFKICVPHQSVMPFLSGAPPSTKNPGSAPEFTHNLKIFHSSPQEPEPMISPPTQQVILNAALSFRKNKCRLMPAHCDKLTLYPSGERQFFPNQQIKTLCLCTICHLKATNQLI